MSCIEFTYFKGFKGRGEPVRIALHAAGVEWKDTSVSFDELKAVREATPGKWPAGLPVMKLASGQEVGQSVAMVRYAAKLGSSGLYPSDPGEALIVDCIMDTCQDALTKCPQEPNEEIKKQKREEYAAGKLKVYMTSLAEQIKTSGGPFLLGAKLTVADLVLRYFLVDLIKIGMFDYVAPEYVDTWPELKSHMSAVDGSEIVKAYQASL
jgi:glutathione S-transferase